MLDIRQAPARRPPARDDRAGAPAHPEDDRARGLLVRRHLVDGVRDRGDPLRHRGRRRRASRSGSTTLVPIAIVGRDPARDRRHVVPPDDLRLPERRRLATSSAARTSARSPSLVAGASLLVDYILTVAVSISAGVAAIISIPAFQRPRRRTASRSCLVLIVLHHARQPARHQGVGPHLRGPDVHLHRRCSRAARRATGSSAASFGDIGTDPVRPGRRSRALQQHRRHARRSSCS